MKSELSRMKEELLENVADVMQYWTENSWDEENKIFLTLGCDNLPLADGRRSAILISRVLWAYSAAYRLTGREEYLEMAEKAFQDITEHYLDQEYGGIYESLHADGTPLKTAKRVYTQSYLIYAMSEYYMASMDAEALSVALNIFEKIEDQAFDPEIGGYISELTREWSPVETVLQLDTYLHLMECYTNLHKAYPDGYLKGRLQTIVILLLTKFLRPEGCLYQELHTDWTATEDLSDRFADDAECCWMMLEARDRICDASMDAIITKSCVNMMRHLAEEGIDPVNGGVFDRKNTDGSMSTDKMWWEESESVTGLLYAYKESGEKPLLKAALDTYAFLRKYIMQPGQEWYWRVSADGSKVPVEDPSRPPKCPYHSVRISTLCVPLIEGLEGHA